MSLTLEATKEIRSKLQKVEKFIQADASTIAKQQQTIESQRAIIAKQRSVIQHVRDELLEMKKQILINEAKSTPQHFRDNLSRYLLHLRDELIKLEDTNKTQSQQRTAKPSEQTDEKYTSPTDDKDEYEITPAGRSALYIAAGRAIESQRGGRDRLFVDEYADRFAKCSNNAGYNFISLFADALTQLNHESKATGDVSVDYLSGFVAFRTKWIDDQIYYALQTDKQRMRKGQTRGTIKQIVNLGVGCDTRSFRLSKLPKDLKMYNLDTADMIQFRKHVLGDDLGICQYIDVECDLEQGQAEWMDKLIKSGFNPSKKCIWICEGIFEYIAYDVLVKVLKVMSANSCDGSWLIGEIPNKVNVELKQMHDIWVNLGGQRVVTGIDLPKDAILDQFGFVQCQHVNTLGTLDSNYNHRAPESYVKYQTTSNAMKGDKVTRIQLFRGMKSDEDVDDEKTPL
eukprot:324311_1